MKDKNKQTFIILAFIAIIAFLWFKKQKKETKTNSSETPGNTPGGGGGWTDSGSNEGGDDDNDDDPEDDDPENPNIIVGGLIYQDHSDSLNPSLNPSDLQQYEETNMELLPTRNNEEAKLPMEILPDKRFEDLVNQNLRHFKQSLKISRRETIYFVSNI